MRLVLWGWGPYFSTNYNTVTFWFCTYPASVWAQNSIAVHWTRVLYVSNNLFHHISHYTEQHKGVSAEIYNNLIKAKILYLENVVQHNKDIPLRNSQNIKLHNLYKSPCIEGFNFFFYLPVVSIYSTGHKLNIQRP